MSYNILCLDDDNRFLDNLKSYLKTHYNVIAVDNFDWAMATLKSTEIDLVLLDVEMKDLNGIEALKLIKEKYPSIEVVMLSGHKDPKNIVEAIRHGAADYLTKDTFPEELIAYINKTLSRKDIKDKYDALLQDYNSKLNKNLSLKNPKSFDAILSKANRLKGSNANVLINGESGTGKEVLARYIHSIEEQPRRPFIAVNCAAIPDQMLESELFGHEKGAFTGAIVRKIGKFELADKGDILLDEINSMKMDLQAKILRALETKEFYRLGSIKPIKVSFRVIATSNVNLEEQIKKNRFRGDLYHRLNVISITIPPLRDRIDDIHEMINQFMSKYCLEHKGTKKKSFSTDAMKALLSYDWPGNIRELKNLIKGLVIMCSGEVIELSDLPDGFVKVNKDHHHEVPKISPNEYIEQFTNKTNLPLFLFRKEVEEKYIKRIIREKEGNKSAAAKALGISRYTLYEILKKQDVQNTIN
ncbi:MAG: sigma-54-dependent Fis family transcriptional regulator [Deltaproteobacteria bacterium]|nr:sigma-54-dependent Fis family transcriptional regulator [Deltaproteobacteria bacterium]